MTNNYKQLGELCRGGERTKCAAGEHRAENSLAFLAAAGNERLLRALEGAEENPGGLTARPGVLRAAVRSPAEDRGFTETLYLKRLQDAVRRLGLELELVGADGASVSDGGADVELWERGSNFLGNSLLRTRALREGTVAGKPFFTEKWEAQSPAEAEGGLKMLNGLWSEIQLEDDGDRGKLLSAGVDNYVIIDNGSFVRYTLEGGVLEYKTLTLSGNILTSTDACGNSARFELGKTEGLGGYRLTAAGGDDKRTVFLRPWLDHTYEVQGLSASGSRLGPFFVGICEGVASWRFEDGNLGCVCGADCDGSSLTWRWSFTDAAGNRSGCSKKGVLIFNKTGFSWRRENGERLDFKRTFDGVWRCPGWDTFCLSSQGNVKVFKNYQKKYRTPVVYVSDYESGIVTEHYLSGKKLSYSTQFFPGSQIMDGIDGNDLGRRFVNLDYFDGEWNGREGEAACSLSVSRGGFRLKRGNTERAGKMYCEDDAQTWVTDGVKTEYAVNITGLNSFELARPGEALRFERAGETKK